MVFDRVVGALLLLSVANGKHDLDRSAADTTGGNWIATRSDVDIYPDFAHRTLRVHGRVTLKLSSGTSMGPSLRLGHDLTRSSNRRRNSRSSLGRVRPELRHG